MKDKLLFYSQKQINRISEFDEKENWKNGILSLYDLLKTQSHQLNFFGNDPILESIQALEDNDISFFKNTLQKSDYYRIAFSYPEKVMFLDIETTGLSKEYSYITVIGWYLNGEYKYNLYGNDINELVNDLKNTELIVTFNGSLFDLPFLKKHYPELEYLIEDKAHIDLRFFLKRFGYVGGQKEIENLLEFKRPKILSQVDGKEAISLWYKFLKGDKKALQNLLYYNCYDILGMVFLLNSIFFEKIYGKNFPKVGKPKKFSSLYKKKFIEYNDVEINNSCRSVQKNITFFKQHFLNKSFNYSVMGIDLTGSEHKASGCAVIQGSDVETKLIFTDEELIEYIVQNNVNLVSIDSPLSLPYGRTSVFDDDPKREEIGIMRKCERILKRRGVNVYPSLIPSMQNLTKRGISLAQKIRKLGIPVIESFPGAAQDVLQIPRKKTDLFFLKQGLIDFGITGNFIKESVSHDELDAITSAIVGQFFICNYYEALGSLEENYLIIPSIKSRYIGPKIIGVCGPIATGKTELSRYIESKGYVYIRYSMVIADYLKENKIEPSRQNLQKYGQKIFSEYGQYWLNKKLISRVKNNKYIVVDGLRHPEDITFLKEYSFSSFTSVYIESSFEKRKERFEKLDSQDYSKVSSHEVEQNIEKLKKLSDLNIINNGTKEDFFKQIEKLI